MDTIVLETREGAVLRYPQTFNCPLVETPYRNARAANSGLETEALTRTQLRRSRKKKKSHRTLNKGEVLQNEYHAKVKDDLMLCYTHLLEMGRNCGYFPVHQTAASPHCNGSDLDLASFCELDAIVPLTEVLQPFIIDSGCLTDLDLYGHLVCNPSDASVNISALGKRFHIPSRSSFLLSDFSKIGVLVDSAASIGKQFDLIIVDPPWENRSAIRGKKYQWLSMDQFIGLPIPKLASLGALVAIWVTNKRKFAHFVQQTLFPAWGVKTVAEWHWIKVTTEGNLVHDIDSVHKKPYETLIIGKYIGNETCPPDDVDVEETSSYPSAKKEAMGAEMRNTDTNTVVSLSEEEKCLHGSGRSTTPDQPSVHSNEIGRNEHSPQKEEIPTTLNELAGPAQHHVMEQCTSTGAICASEHHSSRQFGSIVHSDICSDEPPFKRPRLPLYLPLYKDSSCKATDREHTPISLGVPYNYVILCVPSCVHSQKPYLGDLLLQYTAGRKRCLELFARNLLPNWTSWGNEVLKFQEISSN